LAPASVCSIARRKSSPLTARACATLPRSKVSSTPSTSRLWKIAGNENRTRPLAESSTGPVNTSPSGKFFSPAALIQVRPATETVRSTSGPWNASVAHRPRMAATRAGSRPHRRPAAHAQRRVHLLDLLAVQVGHKPQLLVGGLAVEEFLQPFQRDPHVRVGTRRQRLGVHGPD